MKTSLLVLKVTALMLVIFASGVWVGRQTGSNLEIPAEPAADLPSLEGLPPNLRKVTGRYIEELQLSPEQQDKIVPLMQKAARQLTKFPKNSPERLAALEHFHEMMAPHLNATQQEKALAILAAARERVEEKPGKDD